LFFADGQMDGQTDITKLRVILHSFANMHKNHKTYGEKCVFQVSYNIGVTHSLR
jgi:hypothetical protein